MHLLPIQSRSLDDEAAAVELDLNPADLLVLSFTDTDLAVAAEAWGADGGLPSLRLIHLGRLKHPFSVDTFIEKLASKARFVLVRLLGGADYWRYGVEELGAAARRHSFALAFLPGDDREDPRLEAASTLTAAELAALSACVRAGGAENMGRALRLAASKMGHTGPVTPPVAIPAAGLHAPATRPAEADAPQAAILFYRSALLAADTGPITALADALAVRGAAVTAFFVTSLKDADSIALLQDWLKANRPDVILNTTAFSASGPTGRVLDRADCPVIQAVLSGSDRDAWLASPRGLGAADLAMNVALPEVDGRIACSPISFKADTERQPHLEYTRVVHRADLAGIAQAADLALAWAALRRVPRRDRRLACVVPDYPGKKGRAGYAVGLDTERSLAVIADHLRREGFDVGTLPGTGARLGTEPQATRENAGSSAEASLMRVLAEGERQPTLPLDVYRRAFADLPPSFAESVLAAWGDAADDPDCADDLFRHRFIRAGKLVAAVQPDRGGTANRRADYHDPALPPRHGYIAFYLWLRTVERCHAVIHLGTHGTLEWLPGKAVALSPSCAPQTLAGATPMIYPFIVNNPGEAAQAKRRIGAVILGHLTPALVETGVHGDTSELEQLFDEYAEAATLDPRRARLVGQTILALARDRDLLPNHGPAADPENALVALDAWLCDLKEMRIGDGLHVFGQTPAGGADRETAACGPAELGHLVRALDGRFVPPGPAGTPGSGRTDVLPTGRNLFAIDPRAVPTRTAWQIGARMADDLLTRYAQDHGDWPRRVVLDLWGSATMRTGGDDLAQAFALIGTRPTWDHASGRVSGFEITPLAKLGRSRVDVTLRISGLFRDTFPEQIALFDAAVRALAALDEDDADNPLAEARRAGESLLRAFGAPPGAYGTGLADRLNQDPAVDRGSLGATYLGATSHAFGPGGHAQSAPAAFRDRVAAADAFSHTEDLPGQDLLESDVFAAHQGGFAAAAALLGATPALYQADTSGPGTPRLRNLEEAIARALHGRATNPRWLAGQMRHGHRGAIAMAETLDALFAFAATTDAVPSRHFDRYFDATLGDDAVRAFLTTANPVAARSMAAKFEAALACGYWTTRRNSVVAVLTAMTEALTSAVASDTAAEIESDTPALPFADLVVSAVPANRPRSWSAQP